MAVTAHIIPAFALPIIFFAPPLERIARTMPTPPRRKGVLIRKRSRLTSEIMPRIRKQWPYRLPGISLAQAVGVRRKGYTDY